ncbi:conserved exported hypothetical protein [Tenacibaculum sp. 190130A14a]|uniref:Lipoprotein n=2 Tax=Tenacibaculum polynesiense TaxID=3137857 RepID=A0ABP1F8B3_9FLAO
MKPINLLIAAVLVCLVFMACASSKHRLVETTMHKKDSVHQQSRSVVSTEIHKAIDDAIFLPITTGDSLVDSVIHQKLWHFKTFKKSGQNSYTIRYNTTAKGFDITSKIAGTENSLVQKSDSIQKVTKQQAKKVEIQTIIKYRIPKWFLIFFAISLVAVYLLVKLKVI